MRARQRFVIHRLRRRGQRRLETLGGGVEIPGRGSNRRAFEPTRHLILALGQLHGTPRRHAFHHRRSRNLAQRVRRARRPDPGPGSGPGPRPRAAHRARVLAPVPLEHRQSFASHRYHLGGKVFAPQRVDEDRDAIGGTPDALRVSQRAVQIRPSDEAANANHLSVPVRLAGGEVRLGRVAFASLGRAAPDQRGWRWSPRGRRGREQGQGLGVGVGDGLAVGVWRRGDGHLEDSLGHGLVEVLPRLAGVYELFGLRVCVVRSRSRLERLDARRRPSAEDHLRSRVVVARDASDELQGAESDLRSAGDGSGEGEERREDAGGGVEVGVPRASDERGAARGPRRVGAAAGDVPELLAPVRAAGGDEHLQRDAHHERRALDVRGVRPLGHAAVEHPGAPSKRAARGLAGRSRAKLSRGRIPVRAGRAKRRVQLPRARRDGAKVEPTGRRQRTRRLAHATRRRRRHLPTDNAICPRKRQPRHQMFSTPGRVRTSCRSFLVIVVRVASSPPIPPWRLESDRRFITRASRLDEYTPPHTPIIHRRALAGDARLRAPDGAEGASPSASSSVGSAGAPGLAGPNAGLGRFAFPSPFAIFARSGVCLRAC